VPVGIAIYPPDQVAHQSHARHGHAFAVGSLADIAENGVDFQRQARRDIVRHRRIARRLRAHLRAHLVWGNMLYSAQSLTVLQSMRID
jgi:hypothetical protein